MNLNELYLELYSDLVALADSHGIDQNELEKYFVPEGNTSNESLLKRLAITLQNSGNMQHTIRFEENEEIIKKVLCNFNFIDCKFDNHTTLYNSMIKNGITDNGSGEKKETNWQKYCKGLYEGINYLKDDNNRNRILSLTKETAPSDENIKLIKDISQNIHGLGIALTCDWLKEIGCVWLAKPDIHIKEVVKYISEKDKSDIKVLNYMYKWSQAIDGDVTTYKLDKIIWLLCTSNFYLDKKIYGRKKILSKVDKYK